MSQTVCYVKGGTLSKLFLMKKNRSLIGLFIFSFCRPRMTRTAAKKTPTTQTETNDGYQTIFVLFPFLHHLHIQHILQHHLMNSFISDLCCFIMVLTLTAHRLERHLLTTA